MVKWVCQKLLALAVYDLQHLFDLHIKDVKRLQRVIKYRLHALHPSVLLKLSTKWCGSFLINPTVSLNKKGVFS